MTTRKGERSRTDLKPLPFSGGVDTEVEPNDYDKARKVVPVKDTRSLPIGARTLSTEMSCPICLDLLSQTMTAKECLHRFCSECITMALQRGNKECPTCRKKLVSKRSLRPDPNFDLLISKVWPDRSIYDNLQTHEMQLRREGSPDDDEIEMVTGEDGIAHPKKKKIGYDADSMTEYFLAQQSRNRRRADEEEFPELNGEQAFMEREAIDNLLDNGSMHYYEDYENDDDVYGDEMEIDESGNLVEVRHREPPQPEPEESAEDVAGPGDDGEGDDDDEEYEPIDSMAALTPEQQEELQADLDELEAIEFEHYELDFSDEELPEEGDPTIEEMERNNGLRCTSDTEDDAETEMEKKAATRRIIESIEEGTSDSSASSPLTIEGKPEEVDRDATLSAYAPESPKKEEPKKEDRPPLLIQAVLKTAPDRPFPEGTLEDEDRLEFTPPKDDDEDPPPGPCSITSLMASPPVDPAVLGAFGLGPTSVIAIAPAFGTGGAIVKEEQTTPPPVDVAGCSDITIIEEDDDSSDSTSTTYSSSGCTTSTSTLSSTISIEYSDGYDDPEPTPLNMDISFTEGDIQIPNNPHAFSMLAQASSSSAHVKHSWTSLTAFSEDLPPHREDPCCSTEEEIDVEGIRPPSSTIPSTERLCHWLANSPSSPQSTDEDMAGAPERRPDDCDVVEPISGSEEIEAELLPACSLMQRDCPEELLIPRYVRAKHDTKMEHLAEFIHQRAMEECQSNQTDFDADPVPTIPKPKHFYVFSRNGGHHVKQIFLHETMSTALCAMTQGDHLIIFFDITGIDLRGEKLSLLADVIPSHFLNLPTV